MNPNEELAAIARTQLGTEEDAAHTNKGAAIKKYQDETELSGTQGWPWCAAYVDWCVHRFIEKHPELKLKRPTAAAAFGLIDWGRANNCLVFTPSDTHHAPAVGDIVVFEFSHCGIVSAAPSKVKGYDFDSIEGNTNDDGSRDGYEVCERHRVEEGRHGVRAFIRIYSEGEKV